MDVHSVVFDVGGVLVDWNPRHLYRKLFDDEAEMERFLESVCTQEWHYQHDLGRPFSETCAELAARFPEHEHLIMAWARQDEMVGGAITGTVEVLAALRAGSVPCFALSNWSAAPFAKLFERFEFLAWFDGIVVSSYEGCAKPDPAIFECLLRRYELAAGSTLFVDDSLVHIDSARRLGMRVHHFTTPETLAGELHSIGLLPRRDCV